MSSLSTASAGLGAGTKPIKLMPADGWEFQPYLIDRGAATGVESNVRYRLDRLAQVYPIKGMWLDLGCADGAFARGLLERGAERVIGVDVEADRVAEAGSAGSADAAYGCAVAERLPFPSDTFDGVFMNEVLEHVENEEESLAEVFRVLKPGGALALMSPNRFFPFEGHGMRIGSLDVNTPMPILPWIPSNIGNRFMRARNYWPWDLRRQLTEASFWVELSTSVFPQFEQYPLFPASFVKAYKTALPLIERTPVLNLFGLSNFLIARKPIKEGGVAW